MLLGLLVLLLLSVSQTSNGEQILTTLAGRSSKDVLIAGFAVRMREKRERERDEVGKSRAQLQPS